MLQLLSGAVMVVVGAIALKLARPKRDGTPAIANETAMVAVSLTITILFALGIGFAVAGFHAAYR